MTKLTPKQLQDIQNIERKYERKPSKLWRWLWLGFLLTIGLAKVANNLPYLS